MFVKVGAAGRELDRSGNRNKARTSDQQLSGSRSADRKVTGCRFRYEIPNGISYYRLSHGGCSAWVAGLNINIAIWKEEKDYEIQENSDDESRETIESGINRK